MERGSPCMCTTESCDGGVPASTLSDDAGVSGAGLIDVSLPRSAFDASLLEAGLDRGIFRVFERR